MYKLFIGPFLFLFNPETAHHFTLGLLKLVLKFPFAKSLFRFLYCVQDDKLKRNLFGLEFPNPVGLAAGFDKNALYIDELACLGFGFIEIGTVTPLPQPGNDKPRLFRLPADNALINRMGFNNDGVEIIVERLKKRKSNIIVGGNIGKNKVTPNENAADDFVKCFEGLFEHVDYFVVNVSSPNTPGLRELQDKEPLLKILYALQEKNQSKQKRKPILLKIAPDLTNEQLDDILSIVLQSNIDGILATNTTINRENLKTDSATIQAIGNGGLSGKPVTKRSTEVLQYLSEKSNHKLPLIGVGGIFSGEDAQEKINAGTSLIQLYTGFIYEGPGLVKRCCKAFRNRSR
ncbi:MAG: quinone-dependent dihydroorotate dehydrogenase [Chitinophagales bacterium]|nr:quinone-dependent dihydroorotate dehydrogenase [Chitinophagales bacterium]